MKVALIGLGVMGRNHARVLNEMPNVELVAVVDPLQSEINSISTSNYFSELKSLKKIELDYCVIAAPTNFHFEIANWAIDRKLPFLIEKPLTSSYQTALKLSEKTNSINLPACVGHIERFNAAAREAKARIKNGEIGKVYQIRTIRQGPFPARISDVGVIFDLATHDIDLAGWILDDKCINVFAQTAKTSGREFEDLVCITSKYSSGVIANHVVNWLSPMKERSVQILGERGALVIDTLSSNLTFYANGSHKVTQNTLSHFVGVSQGEVHTYAFEKPEPLRVEHETFIDLLLGRPSEIVTILEGAETIKVAEAVFKSSQLGNSVNV